MKRKWNILFALLAAAALVLAAGCSDGSSDAWSDEAASPDSGVDSNVASGDADNTGGDSADGNASDAGGSGSGDNSGGDGNASDAGDSSTGSDSGSGDAGNTGGGGGDNGGGGGSSTIDSGTGGDAGGDAGNTGGDSGSGNASDAGSSGDNGGGEDAGITLIEISSDDVEELLQSIGTVKGKNSATGCYWDFAAGTLETSDEGYTFTVAWVDNNKSSSNMPTTGATLSYIKDVGKVSTSLLALDLSDAEWDEKPEREGGGVSATTGTVKASIELSEDASASHTIPESLQSVTIVLESDVGWGISS